MLRVRELAICLGLVLALGVATAFASPPVPSIGDSETDACPADVNEDGYVGFEDLLAVLYEWGECPIVDDRRSPDIGDRNNEDVESRECSRADIDGNESVGFSDLLLVLEAYSIDCDKLDGG